jgi:renalase
VKIAIIGAGFSGSYLYHLLKKDGEDVTLFEKSRGSGGRCSTRYIGDKLIDHGTPYFQANDKSFEEFCDQKVQENILIKQEQYYYPQNGINKLCSSMIDECDLVKNTKIVSCDFDDQKWNLKDESGLSYENFDKLILTIPTSQVLQLDINLSTDITNKLKSVEYDSIATLLIYSHTLQNIMNPKLIEDKSFKKIVDNSSKYDYKNFSSYVIHLDETLTNKQNFQNKEEVKKYILEKVHKVSGINLEDDFHILPHLWRYAFVSKSINEDFIFDENLSLGMCGDYFNGKDLEGAYLSSKTLYEDNFKK